MVQGDRGIVITGRDLKVVSANARAGALSARGCIGQRDDLLEHFPQLSGRISPRDIREETFSGIPLDGTLSDLLVMPAGDLVSFVFQPSAEGAQASVDAELHVLREQNRHLLAVIEEAPVGIMLIDGSGRIVYMNRKQEENSRKKREEIMNRPLKEVYRRAFMHPAVEDMYQELINGREKKSSLFVDHYYPQFYRRDMIIKFLGHRLDELDWVVLFVEIEDELYREKRKAEKAGQKLRQSKTFLAQVLDASPNMVISVDGGRRVVSFNRTAEVLLGFSPSQVFNTPVDRFFPPEELPKIHEAVSSPTPWFGTTNIYRFDKTTFQIELYAAKIRDPESGDESATVLLGVDVEERERLRMNLIQSQKMNFIGELVSALAHQMNNPLVGVMNITDVLMRRIDRQDRNYELLRMIRDAGGVCQETISRLLAFSRKPQKNRFVEVSIQDVLASSIELVGTHALFKKIRLTRSFHTAPLIRGDPVLLQQAFMNLLYNSAQAVDGDGEINVSCTGVYGMGRQVEITVSDNGKGIPREDIHRIFEPFFTTKSAEKGTGIGLSLVYWIVQDHKGRIEVESEEGKGTTFTVQLPAIMG
jgi:PAS domain S-box-containing protein